MSSFYIFIQLKSWPHYNSSCLLIFFFDSFPWVNKIFRQAPSNSMHRQSKKLGLWRGKARWAGNCVYICAPDRRSQHWTSLDQLCLNINLTVMCYFKEALTVHCNSPLLIFSLQNFQKLDCHYQWSYSLWNKRGAPKKLAFYPHKRDKGGRGGSICRLRPLDAVLSSVVGYVERRWPYLPWEA